MFEHERSSVIFWSIKSLTAGLLKSIKQEYVGKDCGIMRIGMIYC